MADRERAVSLIAQHDELDKQIAETQEALAKLGAAPGVPLLTPDGFPRHDVDVHSARQLRVQLIRQENDMKDLREQIRLSLASALPPKAAKAPRTTQQSRPFCVVKSVLSGSLGDEAGLKADDQIIQFGSVRTVSQLSAEFARLTDAKLMIDIYRPQSSETVSLSVIAEQGRSLGCHVVPL